MSLDWQLQRRLGNRPQNLMLFPAVSLLLHGIVFLGLETYLHMNVDHPLQTEPDKLMPVEFIEVPADKAAVTPPNDAKQKASTNSRSGGKARPELPLATGASAAKSTTPLPSTKPSVTQSKSSTPQPSQDALPPQQRQPVPRPEPLPPQQRQPVPRPEPLPPKTTNQNVSPPVARVPKLTSSPSQPPRQHARRLDDDDDPVNRASHEFIGAHREHLPSDNRLASNSNQDISPPVAPMPKVTSTSSRSLRQSASLLGGPVRLASHAFTGSSRDNIQNSNRLGAGFQGVDARQDIDLGPYLDALRQQVAHHWHPEASHSSEQTIVGFSISRTGQVTDIRILRSSGSTLTDQAAVTAVERASPFGPLPEGYRAEQLNIHFRFNINLFGQLEPKSSLIQP